jgi:photosystem II stability/assembly factor-like uncharacterized protein
MGSTGGGIFKTTNDGITWTNVSDGFLKTGTVGALAVSESNPNIVLAGMGETRRPWSNDFHGRRGLSVHRCR